MAGVMSHVYHEALEGYDRGNIWHDDCPECEDRAANPLHGIHKLDQHNARQAWADMLARWYGGHGLNRQVSECDRRLLDALYNIAVFLERVAAQDPCLTLEMIDAHNDELEAMVTKRFDR